MFQVQLIERKKKKKIKKKKKFQSTIYHLILTVIQQQLIQDTMDYDDDDLDYNSQGEEEEFDENKLNNEEYDLLHDMLPELKKKLKDYNDDISDYDLKEALYYNYFEIDPAIEELKSKFKKSTY